MFFIIYEWKDAFLLKINCILFFIVCSFSLCLSHGAYTNVVQADEQRTPIIINEVDEKIILDLYIKILFVNTLDYTVEEINGKIGVIIDLNIEQNEIIFQIIDNRIGIDDNELPFF